jgi:hypothetical protein
VSGSHTAPQAQFSQFIIVFLINIIKIHLKKNMTEDIFCEYCGKKIEHHISSEHLIGTNHLQCFLEKQLYDDDYRLDQ